MYRNVDLSEISDGKLYELNDLVKVGCNDCQGCHDCCCHMGNSVILDPLDVYRITINLGKKFEELLEDKLELHVVDGIILPNLKMAGTSEECVFLKNERCSIHPFRPGYCRIFPLGRYYETGSLRYFLQIHECRMEHKTKIKVKKWIDTPDLKKNQRFISDWHYFLREVQGKLDETKSDDRKLFIMKIISTFFACQYDSEIDFYVQFDQRLCEVKEYMKI